MSTDELLEYYLVKFCILIPHNNLCVYRLLQHCLGINSYNSTFLKNLFRTQKKAIRLINSSPWNTGSTPLFYKSGILKLHDLNTFQVACIMYQLISAILPVPFQFSLFQTKICIIIVLVIQTFILIHMLRK